MTRDQMDGREALIELGEATESLGYRFMQILAEFGETLYELPRVYEASLAQCYEGDLRKKIQIFEFDFDTFLQMRAHICAVRLLAYPAEELADHYMDCRVIPVSCLQVTDMLERFHPRSTVRCRAGKLGEEARAVRSGPFRAMYLFNAGGLVAEEYGQKRA
ncbi:hypothetical protein [Halomonas sp. I5-271120]|uniref:hypothetical protein n=1 Tax=Halomonas sp. I5-271120 TaxID=3061632 RepID=UPI0027146FF2|nr:hypothetical protein [Halomonas sp. I5-271120]